MEYLISTKKHDDDWMEEILSNKGIKEIARDIKYLFVKSYPEIMDKLGKQYTFLKIEEIHT